MRHRSIPGILALLAAAPCAAADSPVPLRIGLIGPMPAGLHRDLSTLAPTIYAGGFIQRGMTHFDDRGRTVCSLCEELPTLQNGGVAQERTPDAKQGQRVTFRLRPGLKWDDGTALAAEDFVFAWQLGRRDDSGYAWRTRLAEEIWSVTAADDRTLVVRRRGVSCDPADFRIAPLPRHLERAPAAGAGNYASDSLYVREPSRRGLYNGPYRVVDIASGRIRLERNSAWAGPQPVHSSVELVFLATPEATADALLDGTVDLVPALSSGTLAVAETAARRAPGKLVETRRAGRNLVQVSLNLARPPFDDVRVRTALLLAIDRAALAGAFGEGAEPAASILTARFPHHRRALPQADAKKARALLSEAGWTRTGEETLRNAQGAALQFRLSVQRSLANSAFVAELLSAWRSLGVDAQTEPFGGLGSLAQADGPQAALFGWTLEGGANVDYAIFDSRAIPQAGDVRAGSNVFRYTHPQVDRIVDRLRASCAADELGPLYEELQRHVGTDLPLLPLFFTPEVQLARPAVLGPRSRHGAFYNNSDETEHWRFD